MKIIGVIFFFFLFINILETERIIGKKSVFYHDFDRYILENLTQSFSIITL